MNHPTTPHPVEEATFAAGCFWCIETAFNQLRGVVSAESGYSNGAHPKPDYESVCGGQTGHAEVVRVRFNPTEIGFAQLLEVFFARGTMWAPSTAPGSTRTAQSKPPRRER